MEKLKNFGKLIAALGFALFGAGYFALSYEDEILMWFGMVLATLGILFIGTALLKEGLPRKTD